MSDHERTVWVGGVRYVLASRVEEADRAALKAEADWRAMRGQAERLSREVERLRQVIWTIESAALRKTTPVERINVIVGMTRAALADPGPAVDPADPQTVYAIEVTDKELFIIQNGLTHEAEIDDPSLARYSQEAEELSERLPEPVMTYEQGWESARIDSSDEESS